MAAADKVSEGERLYIQGVEAGANGDTKLRGECYQKLVAAFPDDELSHQLLGIHYNPIQQYEDAAAEYRKAVQLAPNFAPAYNQLGYALRAVEKNADAEAAFRRYIELIPNEPNPYDSLAELQMRMGRFAESIESYKKALSINPRFLSAYRGIGANLMYQDKHKEALESFQKAYDLSTTDGEKRLALAEMAVCYMDGNKLKDAIESINRISVLAEQRGDLLLNAGKIADAGTEFTKALELARQADIPDKVKKNVELGSHGNRALVACAKKDFKTAKREAEILRAGFEASGNPTQIRGAHQVLGIIALHQKNYDDAIAHLKQANAQWPYVMLQLAKAYAGKKDANQSKAYYRKAAEAYTLSDMDYAMIRHQAKKALAK